jgi:hypothetical protein
MLPYSSIFLGGTSPCGIEVVHEADVVQLRLKPPTSTVAVTVELAGRPVVSTVIELVPWPLEIVPAETVQLKVGVTSGEPLSMVAVKVIGLPAGTVSGQETLTVGQARASLSSLSLSSLLMQPVQASTVTVVSAKEMQPQPSSTSTVTV